MVPSRLSAPPRVTGFALALAAATAATLVVYWARIELPLSIRPRRALQSTVSWSTILSLPPAQDRVFGSPLRRIRLDDRTPEFEPQAYSRYYNDDASNLTDSDLVEHYLSVGRPANRVYQRLRVVLSYEPGAGYKGPMASKFGGLCNQIYAHVGMLTVALYSGCEVVLPAATHRGGRLFQDIYDKDEIVVLREPLSTLFDVDHLMQWANARDATFHRDEPDLGDAVIALEMSGPSICCWYPLETIVGTIVMSVKNATEEYLRNNPGRPLPPVRLVLKPPMLLFALSTNANQDLIEDVSRNLQPAPHIQSLADTVVARLTAAGPYNGVHLRMEEDAHMWDEFNSPEEYWNLYIDAMLGAGFNRSAPLYVASGLLSYMSMSDWHAAIVSRLLDRGVCSKVVHKESILGGTLLEGLQSEALALVDLLVLVRAQRFTGFGASTFSWVAEELRCLAGSPTSTTSYPGLSTGILPDLWRDTKVLSNHEVTCPDTTDEHQQGGAVVA